MRSNKSGFTLIELLVVIAIIAILAAILFPVFGKCKEGAKKTMCAQHMSELSKVILMYADDHNGFFPCNGPAGQAYHWDYQILSYVKNRVIYHCPSYVRDKNSSTYGFNQNLFAFNSGGVKYASRTLLIFDVDNNGYIRPVGSADSYGVWHWGAFQYRHSDGDNLVFVDGHVKWVRTRTLYEKGISYHQNLLTWEGMTFNPNGL